MVNMYGKEVDLAPARSSDEQHRRFLTLYARHVERLRAYVGSMVRDWHMAEDINQELSIALWESFDKYDPDRPFISWARGVARNKVLHAFRTQRRAMPTLSPEAVAAITAAFERAEDLEESRLDALEQCLEQLDEGSRRLVSLRYREGQPLADVAEQRGASLAAVTKALARLRSRLADCVRQRMVMQ